MQKPFIFCFLILLSCTYSFSQDMSKHSSKISLSLGYGFAGSFTVNDYVESLPFPAYNYGKFAKKNFLGNSQQINISFRLSKNYELNAGLQYQHFTRRVKATDTLSNVVVYLDNTIHERNYIYSANLTRVFERKKGLYSAGLGLYYIRPVSESIEFGTGIPNFFSNYEARYSNSRSEEGGTFIQLGYEYKFQPKVNIGVKTQFYYTISTASAESITLFPYIKLLF